MRRGVNSGAGALTVVRGTESSPDQGPRSEQVEESRRNRVLHGEKRLSQARDVQFPPVDRPEQLDPGEALLARQPRALIQQRDLHDLLRTGIVAPPKEHDAVRIGDR